MLVIADGRTEMICSHPSLIKLDKQVYCSDCQQCFNSRTKVYKRFVSHASSQDQSPKNTTVKSDSSKTKNQQRADRRNGKTSSGGKSGDTGSDCRGKDKTRRRHVSAHSTPRTDHQDHSDNWNSSPEGLAFWSRVDLIWRFLTYEEQHHAYFTQGFNYPRGLQRLEAVEARRQLELPISKPYEAYESPRDCIYQWNDTVSYSAIAYGERRIRDTVLIRLHYIGTDGLVHEVDSKTNYVQWAEADPLSDLEQEKEQLSKEAEYAPDNGWIETGRVQGKNFKQAWWRGKYSQGKKTIYIGKVGSAEYAKARNAQKARKELKKVLRQIEKLKKG